MELDVPVGERRAMIITGNEGVGRSSDTVIWSKLMRWCRKRWIG